LEDAAAGHATLAAVRQHAAALGFDLLGFMEEGEGRIRT
jgi:hypothetical protein